MEFFYLILRRNDPPNLSKFLCCKPWAVVGYLRCWEFSPGGVLIWREGPVLLKCCLGEIGWTLRYGKGLETSEVWRKSLVTITQDRGNAHKRTHTQTHTYIHTACYLCHYPQLFSEQFWPTQRNCLRFTHIIHFDVCHQPHREQRS